MAETERVYRRGPIAPATFSRNGESKGAGVSDISPRLYHVLERLLNGEASGSGNPFAPDTPTVASSRDRALPVEQVAFRGKQLTPDGKVKKTTPRP